jgi:hypothetical protein
MFFLRSNMLAVFSHWRQVPIRICLYFMLDPYTKGQSSCEIPLPPPSRYFCWGAKGLGLAVRRRSPAIFWNAVKDALSKCFWMFSLLLLCFFLVTYRMKSVFLVLFDSMFADENGDFKIF